MPKDDKFKSRRFPAKSKGTKRAAIEELKKVVATSRTAKKKKAKKSRRANN